ncbi:MAG: divergent polysaccharide deacetylase family protein [Acidobacteriota bacterium]
MLAVALATIAGSAGAYLYHDYRGFETGTNSVVFRRLYPDSYFQSAQRRLNAELVRFLKDEAGIRESDVTETRVDLSDAHGAYQKIHWRITWRGGLSLSGLARELRGLVGRDGWQVGNERVEPREWGEYFYLELAIAGRVSHSLLAIVERRRLDPEEIVGARLGDAPRSARAAIIIDDAGFNLALARAFVQLRAPIAVSVLPYLPDSVGCAEAAHDAGKEVMVHLPMEPWNYPTEDPGPGAIFRSMTSEEARRATLNAIEAVPFAVGMNNHMGSRVTTYPRLMEVVLRVAKDQGIFFVDSRTTTTSKGLEIARRIGVRSASRQVFVDDIFDSYYIGKMIEQLFATARRDGQAIAIGHMNPVTLEALRANLWKAERYDVRLCSVSELVK